MGKGKKKRGAATTTTTTNALGPRGRGAAARSPNLRSIQGLKNEGILADLEFESTSSLAKTFKPYLLLQDIAQSSKEKLVRSALEARPKMGPKERADLYRELYKDDAPLWDTIVFASRSCRAIAVQAETAKLPFGAATTEAYREAAKNGEWTEARVSSNGSVQWRSHRVQNESGRSDYFGYGVRFDSPRACLENDESKAIAVFVTGKLAVVDWHLSRIVDKLLFAEKLADGRLSLVDLADVQSKLEQLRNALKRSQPVLERSVPTREIFDATEQQLEVIVRQILTAPDFLHGSRRTPAERSVRVAEAERTSA